MRQPCCAPAHHLAGADWQLLSVPCRVVQQMGASELRRIFTAGGGAASTKWTEIRAARLDVPVFVSPQAESAYGSALLAREGWLKQQGLPGQLDVIGLDATDSVKRSCAALPQ